VLLLWLFQTVEGNKDLRPTPNPKNAGVAELHIPDEADQRSGVMSITIPG